MTQNSFPWNRGPQSLQNVAWRKWTLTYSSFAAAALTSSPTLFELPPGGVIHGIKIKHSASFLGGGISAYTISVGVIGDLSRYATAFDCFQAPGSRIYQLSSNFGGEDEVSQTAILSTATSTGANLNAATSGAVNIWALISVAS